MLEQFFKLFAGFRVFQTVSHSSFKVTQFAAAVIALSFKCVSQDKLMIKQASDTVCQLDFVTCTARQVGQQVKNARSQDVAADNSKVGRRFFRFGFFNDVDNTLIVFQLLDFDNTVRTGLGRIDGFNA